jgi:hypothetical protein
MDEEKETERSPIPLTHIHTHKPPLPPQTTRPVEKSPAMTTPSTLSQETSLAVEIQLSRESQMELMISYPSVNKLSAFVTRQGFVVLDLS